MHPARIGWCLQGVISDEFAALNRLQQCVMQVASNASAFCKSLIEAGADLLSNLSDANAVNRPCEQHREENAAQSKYLSLIPCRRDAERQHRSLFIPHAIIIRGDHPKAVLTRRKIGVKGLSSAAGVLPCIVASFKAVAERDFLWVSEAQCRVVNLQVSRAGGKPSIRVPTIGFVLGDDVLNVHRRRYGVPRRIGSVKDLQCCSVGKPYSSVR